MSAALPTLDIAEGALNQLIDTYKLLLPQLGGYLTHAGELNHERLQVTQQQQQQQQ
jgi:5'-3' exoribonuclease 1